MYGIVIYNMYMNEKYIKVYFVWSLVNDKIFGIQRYEFEVYIYFMIKSFKLIKENFNKN